MACDPFFYRAECPPRGDGKWPVQFRNTSLGGSATVRSNRLECVVGERTEVILEIFTILTHQPKHLSGSDDAAAQRLRRHAGIGLRGLERRAPPEMGAVQPGGYGPQDICR